MRSLALISLCALTWLLPRLALAQTTVDRLQRDIRRESGEQEDDPATREPGYLGLIGDNPEQNGSGVQVREIYSGGPADLAGIKPGDIILMVADRNIGGVGDLGAILAANKPGSKLIFTIQREENEFEAMVTLGRRPAKPHSTQTAKPGTSTVAPVEGAPASGSLLGLRALPVTESVALTLGLPRASGAVVTRVVSGSPAELAGIPQGAIIVALDGQEVTSAQDLANRVRAIGPGKTIDLAMYIDGKMHTRQVRLGGTMKGGQPADVPGLAPEGTPPAEAASGPQLGTPAAADSATHLHALEQKIGRLEDRLRRIEHLLEQVLAKESAPPAVGEIDIDTVETTEAARPH